MDLSDTAQRAIMAYGGFELWQSHQFIEAEVTVKGLALLLKRRSFFKHVKIKMEISRPFCKISPIGKDKNITGILDGMDTKLEYKYGIKLAERKHAKEYFTFGRRLFYWDDLDMSYFANYAFWNYFTLPYLLMDKNIIWEEKKEGVLQAIFPDYYPTHSKVQEFHFDKITGLLVKHNYTVDVLNKLAKVTNLVTNHKKTDQLIFPSTRIVTPRTRNGNALNLPILIDLKVHAFKLTNVI